MKILFITKHNPLGSTGGGTMASHAFLRAFSDLCNGNIDICIASNINESDPLIIYNKLYKVKERSFIQKVLSIINGQLHRYTDFVKQLLSTGLDYDICVFDHSSVSGSLVKYVRRKNIKTITIHHNYEPEYFGDNATMVQKLLFLRWVRKNEMIAYNTSDVNLFLTTQDKNKFESEYGINKKENYVIGTFDFKDYKIHCSNVSKKHSVTFIISGTLSSYQTIDAIDYFFKDLYDCLPDNCRIIIAGRNPNIYIHNICSQFQNVDLVPNPIDMNELISQADIYLCPTRIGGGLKLRVMDGLRNGLPVITHSCSARGFDIFYGMDCFGVFDNKDEFKDMVDKMISFVKLNVHSREYVRKIYYENFSYESGLRRLRTLLSL